MPYVYRYAFPALWLIWAIYWWVLSRDVKSAVRREPWESRLMHVVPLLIAFYLLWAARVPIAFLEERFLPLAASLFWIGLALTVGGLLLSVWARRHIGKNWSGFVTIKKGHELITSGPYSLVRHPIYTGLLLAFIGSAVARGEWRGVLAVALATLALWRKLRVEERWMYERFGEAYRDYSKRVAALVPFVL
jgi:protein-S-isoprenylcysteine O-methyltransferase Ste14